MDLQHVDVGSQPFAALGDTREDMFTGKSPLIGEVALVCRGEATDRLVSQGQSFVHGEIDLSQNYDRFSPDLVPRQELTEQAFAQPVAVGVGSVESTHAVIVAVFQQREYLFLVVQDPVRPVLGTEAHAAHDDGRNLQARVTESDLLQYHC